MEEGRTVGEHVWEVEERADQSWEGLGRQVQLFAQQGDGRDVAGDEISDELGWWGMLVGDKWWWVMMGGGWWVMMGGKGMMSKAVWSGYCLIPTTYHLSAPVCTSLPAA